ncbi:phage holin family protein [Qipengyuania qiaonensis]|uniref:Phage holin family protein n=1 Tax=Qipengyuania qiaonensis TaxID=2867240 RepID=A0ABS7J8N3_9SPHN|nr:phage holin family protein [Qipengyuania qiaonensis]MBX7481347.1 phage holin family protein [Qipengyuania qiaonensis]
MRDDDNERAEDYTGPLDLPDEHGAPDTDGRDDQHFSLTDDVVALLEDLKTYGEAELRFQKSRAGFIGNRTKGVVAYLLAAFGVLHLALIAATVGLVLALVPVVGPWAATAIVTVALVVAGVILLLLLKGRLDDIRDAFDDGDDK